MVGVTASESLSRVEHLTKATMSSAVGNVLPFLCEVLTWYWTSSEALTGTST